MHIELCVRNRRGCWLTVFGVLFSLFYEAICSWEDRMWRNTRHGNVRVTEYKRFPMVSGLDGVVW